MTETATPPPSGAPPAPDTAGLPAHDVTDLGLASEGIRRTPSDASPKSVTSWAGRPEAAGPEEAGGGAAVSVIGISSPCG